MTESHGLAWSREAFLLSTARLAASLEDHALAKKLLTPLANEGIVEAMVELGNLYFASDVLSAREAYSLFAIAAEAGNAEANLRLAQGQIAEELIAITPEQRTRCLIKAALSGNADAAALLGYCYATGDWWSFIPRGLHAKKAFCWYLKAAAKGSADAAYAAALMALDGDVPDVSIWKTVNLLRIAFKGGLNEAASKLYELIQREDFDVTSRELTLVWQEHVRKATSGQLSEKGVISDVSL